MGVALTLPKSALLAQANPPSATSGLFEYYVLEHPVLGMLAVLLVGLIAAEVLRRKGRAKPALWTLAAAIAIGAAMVVIGERVETPRERVTAATRSFIDAVTSANVAAAEPHLSPRINFRTDGRVNSTLDRDWLLSVIRGLASAFKSHSLEVLDINLTNDAQSAQVQFRSRAEFTGSSGGGWGLVPSTWEVTWRRDATAKGDAPWRITGIECITIYGKPATSEWINWGNQHRKSP